jgi:uridine phosphorylase
MKQPHILCSENDVSPYVLLPGDPKRVLRVAQFLENREEIAFNREYRSVKGFYKGVPVTVVSTGIGGPSMIIALEELINCGGKYYIRIGSAGAAQTDIAIGDLVIATGAVREDGASAMYVEKNYPAVANFSLLTALVESCLSLEYNFHLGITRSHDSFYIDDEAEQMEKANKNKILASDMETASLYTLASLRGVKAASILNNVVLYRGELKEGISSYVEESENSASEGEKREIIAALEAFVRIDKDNKKE